MCPFLFDIAGCAVCRMPCDVNLNAYFFVQMLYIFLKRFSRKKWAPSCSCTGFVVIVVVDVLPYMLVRT